MRWIFVVVVFCLLSTGAAVANDCRTSAAQAQRTLEQIKQQWPLRSIRDPIVVYVQALGQRLSQVVPLDESPRFWVVRNLEPMGFALGGGQFMISDGLLALVRDEAQLAAVLAHELAHQQLNHFCIRRSHHTARIPLGSVVQHFDLNLEIEADQHAAAVLGLAGFDPRAMSTVLQCLAEREPSSTHLKIRIGELERGSNPRPTSPPVHSLDFLNAQHQVHEDLRRLGADIAGCR